jgi:hypothetical protein
MNSSFLGHLFIEFPTILFEWTPDASRYDPYVYDFSDFELGEDYLSRRRRFLP